MAAMTGKRKKREEDVAPPPASEATAKRKRERNVGTDEVPLGERWLEGIVTAWYPEEGTGFICRKVHNAVVAEVEHFRFLQPSVTKHIVSALDDWRNLRVRFHFDGQDTGGQWLAKDVMGAERAADANNVEERSVRKLQCKEVLLPKKHKTNEETARDARLEAPTDGQEAAKFKRERERFFRLIPAARAAFIDRLEERLTKATAGKSYNYDELVQTISMCCSSLVKPQMALEEDASQSKLRKLLVQGLSSPDLNMRDEQLQPAVVHVRQMIGVFEAADRTVGSAASGKRWLHIKQLVVVSTKID